MVVGRDGGKAMNIALSGMRGDEEKPVSCQNEGLSEGGIKS